MKKPDFLRRTPLVVMAYVRARHFWAALSFWPRYWIHLVRYGRQSAGRFPLRWRFLYPCVRDATGTHGFDRHSTLYTAWAARILAQSRPEVHYDLSSSIYFSTLLSAFFPVRLYDYRPARLRLSNLETGRANLTELPFETGSVASLSCLHVVEHVGLGRYGDPVDRNGDLKAIRELQRVVAPGGRLLFAVPIAAQPRLMFNSERVYSVEMIRELFASAFETREFWLIPDDPAEGDLLKDPTPELLARQFYGCACFWFVKQRA